MTTYGNILSHEVPKGGRSLLCPSPTPDKTKTRAQWQCSFVIMQQQERNRE
jgi:hypothetical protein